MQSFGVGVFIRAEHPDLVIVTHVSFQKQGDCEGISCARPSSVQPTDVQLIHVWARAGPFQKL